MDATGEVGTSLTGGDLQEGPNVVPTLIQWNFPGKNVQVHGSWDNWSTWTPLQCSGQIHSVVLSLQPGMHWFNFFVDGSFCHHPGFSWQTNEAGEIFNFLSVNEPEPSNRTFGIQSQHQKECLISITWKHGGESVLLEGSWDDWKLRIPMIRFADNHYILLSLPPGRYPFKFVVDGQRKLDPNIDIRYDSEGIQSSNILEVTPDNASYFFVDAMKSILLEDFLAQSENEVTAIFKFNVGSLLGSIDPKVEMYPCTNVGFMILNGFFACAKEAYKKGCSWAGRFTARDMVVLDGRHCQIRKRATLPLTREHILLDNYQLKQALLLKFEKNGKFPPYFTHLFWLLESVPEDFDTNEISKLIYLETLEHHAALAAPPRRMLALVTIAQFFKQIDVTDTKFTFLFNQLLCKYYDWQRTVHSDKLLELIYLDGKKMKRDRYGRPIEPITNSGLHMSNFLRVFYVHSPERTLDPTKSQLLESYSEIDLIIVYYFAEFLAQLLSLVRENIDKHKLLKAMWDFYCGGAPPNDV